MSLIAFYDPAERQQEKERDRASDAMALRDGSVSCDGPCARNGFLSSLEFVRSSIVCQEIFA